MAKNFYKTGSIMKFILKEEKLKISLYIISMIVFLAVLVPVFEEILNTSSNMQVLIDTMKNPAMISMIGPVFVDKSYTVGSMYANYMTVFVAIMFASWNILFVNKHTRCDEEMGRSELIRSLPVGRYSSEMAVVSISLLVNLLIAILVVISFKSLSPNMHIESIVNFALATVGFGFLFTAITIFTAQISNTARISNSLSFMILMIFYIMRAIGDVSMESLSLISPLGLISRSQSFVGDYTWPLLILFAEVVGFLILAFVFLKGRDLNSGLLKERKGSTKMSPFVRGIYSFTFKILKNQIFLWFMVILTFAAMYGSTFGDLEGYINSSDLIKQMMQVNPKFSLTEQFVALLVLIMSMITCLPTILFINRIIAEERKFLSEEILNKPVSRYKYFSSFIFLSFVAALIYQLTVGIGFWAVGGYFLDNIPDLSVFVKAVLNYLPAILLTDGVAILLVGIKPKWSWLSYLYLGYSFIVLYIGRMFDLPEIMEKISPFGILPNYPIEKFDLGTACILLLAYFVLIAVGLFAYRRRDINN